MEQLSTLVMLIDRHGVSLVALGLIAIGVIWACKKFSPYVVDWLRSKRKREDKAIENDAMQLELQRQSTAVIENCTVVMEMLKAEKDLTSEAIREHDTRSTLALDHIRGEIGKMRGTLGIIDERTK